ncbi:MAG TPA: SAM-dependent chlorinase/fluorinase [Candidatus Ozemobacteraceae bacterium]|nr:SAM-dependent chlorinase/fluorinase [Candidatus Ozemobacteraceae bacterium]
MPRKPNRVITLLTDFGLEDPFVGVMKGVMAGICRRLQFIDLTHAVPPQNIARASFLLATSFAVFPSGTIHLAIVDPGVGGSRRAVAIRIHEGFLIGPDNGLFSGVLARSPALEVRELSEPRFWRTRTPSATFHGRDVFAPAAAHLASGMALSRLGREVDAASLTLLPQAGWKTAENGAQGVVQDIDRFGNLITSIPASLIPVAGSWTVQVGAVTANGAATYASAAPGSLIALCGSHGYVEVASVNGNAATQTAAAVGTAVRLVYVSG